MGLITKPYTFTGSAAPQLPWIDGNDDVLFSLLNGGITDPNIAANAQIAQAKILGLVTDLTTFLKLDGSRNMTAGLTVKADGPNVRLIGTETSALDFRFMESSGQIIIQRNDGTEAVPSWVTVFSFKSDGLPVEDSDVAQKAYVDAVAKNLQFNERIIDTGGFTTGNPNFEDINGLVTTLTLTTAHRCRVHRILSGITNTVVATISFRLLIDGSVIGASQTTVGNADNNPSTGASGSFNTPVLGVGAHTFQMQWKTSGGTASLSGSTDAPAGIQVEEMPIP